MDADERRQLVDDLIARLEERGAPQGAWLGDLAAARKALRQVDALLARLEGVLLDEGMIRTARRGG